MLDFFAILYTRLNPRKDEKFTTDNGSNAIIVKKIMNHYLLKLIENE